MSINNILIRKMLPTDKSAVKQMMQVFYASDAILSNGSDAVFEADIDTCTGESPYLEGYVFELDNIIIGYSMLAKSYSTEFGMPCIWIEDLYFISDYRNKGIGDRFFEYIFSEYPNHVFRLEAESENKNAIHLYTKKGFQVLPYIELKR